MERVENNESRQEVANVMVPEFHNPSRIHMKVCLFVPDETLIELYHHLIHYSGMVLGCQNIQVILLQIVRLQIMMLENGGLTSAR